MPQVLNIRHLPGFKLIQAFLGHADIRYTAHYTALSPKRLAAVRVR